MQRTLEAIFISQATEDGAGVKINRNVVNGNLAYFDPFLMLDEILSESADDYIAGFPPHPHRGFETVTYMLEGKMRHQDHLGNTGLLKSGGVQWMTAGKGVIHSEMPEQESGKMHGFQLWINLPAKDKMQAARYQEFEPEQVPEVNIPHGVVRVIAGQFQQQRGIVSEIATQASFLDIRLDAVRSEPLHIATVSDDTVLIYVYKGCIHIAGEQIDRGSMAKLHAGDEVIITNHADCGFLFLAGQAINEPIANYGPFVMNTREEINQAIDDYNRGVLVD